MTEIRLHIEGGGESRATKDDLRRGFGAFLRSLRDLACQRRLGWHGVFCGPHGTTYDDFRTALKTHPEGFSVLFVHAEGAVAGTDTPRTHLANRDGRDAGGTGDQNCHLMVQLMEAWFIADAKALARFCGQGFNPNPMPRRPDVEAVYKATVVNALKSATPETGKGEYRKIRHGAKLLEVIDPQTVRARAGHCERLFTTLTQVLTGT